MSNEDTKTSAPPDPEALQEMDEALENGDLRAVAWAWLRQLSRELNVADAMRAVGWARLLERLGAKAGDTEEGLLEASVLGGVLHGFAPRTEEQWEFARKTFDPETYAGIRAWAGLPPEDDERRTANDGEA